MKRLREKGKNSLVLGLIFGVLATGFLVWVYAYPPDFKTCNSSEERDLLARLLVEHGFRVECRHEGDASMLVLFQLKHFQQFIWWAGNQSIPTIYEQPGYFWFLRTDAIPGLVTYEY